MHTSVYNLRHDYYIQALQYGFTPSTSMIQHRSMDPPRYNPYYYEDFAEITLFHILINSIILYLRMSLKSALDF